MPLRAVKAVAFTLIFPSVFCAGFANLDSDWASANHALTFLIFELPAAVAAIGLFRS